MKKLLLLLALTLIVSQPSHSQTATQSIFDIGSSMFSSSKTSKKQKKIDRENFVNDSIKKVTATKVKFVRDSINNVALENKLKEENRIKELEEKKKHEWKYVGTKECIFSEFTINQRTVKFLVLDVLNDSNSFCGFRDEHETESDFKVRSNIAKKEAITAEIFTDTTATTKIGKIELAKIPNEIFAMVATKGGEGLIMIKSLKDNKAYVVSFHAFNFIENNSHDLEPNKRMFISEYTNPLVLAKENAAVANYRTRLNNAISTIKQMVVIQKKHTYKRTNMYGVVVEVFYAPEKFTKLEVIQYNKLYEKLQTQQDDLIVTNKQKVGKKVLQDNLLDTKDFGKQMEIANAIDTFRL